MLFSLFVLRLGLIFHAKAALHQTLQAALHQTQQLVAELETQKSADNAVAAALCGQPAAR